VGNTRKHVGVTGVPAGDRTAGVRSGALRRKEDPSVAESTALALDAQEAPINVNHQVVSLVDPERNEYPIPRRTSSERMTASVRCPTSTGWLLNCGDSPSGLFSFTRGRVERIV
jgi:hypothetical protein